MFTYQTRPDLSVDQSASLDAYAALHGRVQRSLFAAMQAGGKLNDLKRDFLIRFGITARQFNALRIELDGKIASIKERRPELIAESETRIRKAIKVIAKLQKSDSRRNKLHRRVADLRKVDRPDQSTHRRRNGGDRYAREGGRQARGDRKAQFPEEESGTGSSRSGAGAHAVLVCLQQSRFRPQGGVRPGRRGSD